MQPTVTNPSQPIQRADPRRIVERMPQRTTNKPRLMVDCLEGDTAPHSMHPEARAVSIPIYQDYDIRRLVIAVIGQAKRDVENNDDQDARAWLKHEAVAWLDACGLDPDYIRAWLGK